MCVCVGDIIGIVLEHFHSSRSFLSLLLASLYLVYEVFSSLIFCCCFRITQDNKRLMLNTRNDETKERILLLVILLAQYLRSKLVE